MTTVVRPGRFLLAAGIFALAYTGFVFAVDVQSFVFKPEAPSDSSCLKAAGIELQNLLQTMRQQGYGFQRDAKGIWSVSAGNEKNDWFVQQGAKIQAELDKAACQKSENSADNSNIEPLGARVQQLLNSKGFVTINRQEIATGKAVEAAFLINTAVFPSLSKLLTFRPLAPLTDAIATGGAAQPPTEAHGAAVVPPPAAPQGESNKTPGVSPQAAKNKPPLVENKTWLWNAALLLLISFAGWRIRQLEKVCDRQTYRIESLIGRVSELSSNLEPLVTGLSGQFAEMVFREKGPLADMIKREIQNGLQEAKPFSEREALISPPQNVTPQPEPEPEPDTNLVPERPDLVQAWLDILNQYRGRGGVEFDQWRLLGVDLENFKDRQRLPGTKPIWKVLGTGATELQNATFWLVGHIDGPYEWLIPSQSLVAARSIWLQSGPAMINAYFGEVYTWDVGNVFSAKELARVSYDPDSDDGTIVIEQQGRFVFDIV